MIYTLTFNPALDYTTQVENFKIGKINRTKTENILAGGKGLNVSIVLKRLEIENTAISFVAGFTGKELERKIKEYDIKTDFIETHKGYTRINVKISSLEKNSLIQESETALNGNGPEITENDIERLLKKIQKINSNDMVILSGNIPKCINENIYEIMQLIGKKRGAIISGGNIDDEKTSKIILDDFRSGKLGRITIEKVK